MTKQKQEIEDIKQSLKFMSGELITIEQQLITFLDKKGIQTQTDDIEACHPLTWKSKKENLDIILCFVNRKQKVEVSKQGCKLKGSMCT